MNKSLNSGSNSIESSEGSVSIGASRSSLGSMKKNIEQKKAGKKIDLKALNSKIASKTSLHSATGISDKNGSRAKRFDKGSPRKKTTKKLDKAAL